MDKTTYTQRCSDTLPSTHVNARRTVHSGTVLRLVLLAGFLYSLLFTGRLAYADNVPGGNVTDPVVRAVDIAKPAIVRIATTFHAHLNVQVPSGGSVSFPQNSNSSYGLQALGTGTFITAQGDILTADHVINPPQDKTLNQNLYNAAAQDVADYINQHAKQGTSPVSKDQVSQQLASGQLASTPTYDKPDRAAFLSTSYTGPLTANDFSQLPSYVALPVDQIKKESPPDQQDTAIIHVPMQDSPSVQLGDSTGVNQQDTLTIIGFPGNADVNQKPTDLLTSSINQVYVSSLKSSTSGAPLIQVGGNVEHGDSGGPALDNKGQIVGVVSFGAVDTAGDGSTNGTSFLQASASARTMITQLDLDTTPGKFQQQWSQAFSDYASGHWDAATTGFKQLAAAYPNFKAVQPYLDYSQSQASNAPSTGSTATAQPTAHATPTPHPASSNHTTSFNLQSLALTVGVVLLLLLLLTVFVVTTFRLRKRGAKGNDRTATSRSTAGPTPTQGSAVSTAPPATPIAAQQAPQSTQSTLALKAWPCGHLNRSNARFCSVCGEPAPESPTSRRLDP